MKRLGFQATPESSAKKPLNSPLLSLKVTPSFGQITLESLTHRLLLPDGAWKSLGDVQIDASALNNGKQGAPLLGARGGDAAHGGDDSRELPHVLYLCGDIR